MSDAMAKFLHKNCFSCSRCNFSFCILEIRNINKNLLPHLQLLTVNSKVPQQKDYYQGAELTCVQPHPLALLYTLLSSIRPPTTTTTCCPTTHITTSPLRWVITHLPFQLHPVIWVMELGGVALLDRADNKFYSHHLANQSK